MRELEGLSEGMARERERQDRREEGTAKGEDEEEREVEGEMQPQVEEGLDKRMSPERRKSSESHLNVRYQSPLGAQRGQERIDSGVAMEDPAEDSSLQKIGAPDAVV